MAFHKILGKIAYALALGFGALAGPAEAAQLIDFANAAFIQTTGLTSVPYAALELCQRIRSACTPATTVTPAVALTPALWKQLLFVNDYYNTAIKPMTDLQQYHVADFWTYPDSGYGDCEDYQLAKQRELVRDGWPQSDLLMTVVRDKDGEGHAVLIVRTDRGDFVLDNEEGQIRLWSETGYLFLKRQSQGDPSEWVGLIDTHQTTIVANGGPASLPTGRSR